METADAIGPLGAKSMSESPFSPVTPAFANALLDATGVRSSQVPLTGTGCGRRYGTRDLDGTPTRCSRRPRGWCRCR